MTKIIQVPIDPALLVELDRASRKEKLPRAAIIRKACRRYLQEMREEQLDQAYVRGYERTPEQRGTAAAQVKVAGRVLPEERW